VRRLIVLLAVIALVLGGVLAAFVIHRVHEGRNIRGSSTAEFVPTEPPARPASAKVPWPQYGLTPERTRAIELALRPPFRPVWRYQAGSLVEFPPSIGYGRLFFSTNAGNVTAVAESDGSRAWIYRSHRCVAASPAIGPHGGGTVYEAFLNRPPCNAQSGGHGVDGAVIAFAAGRGTIRWQRTIGPSETSPLLVGNRLYVGDWNGWVWALDANNGRVVWRYRTGGAVKGGLAFSGGRLYVGSYDGHVYCLSSDGRLVWRASAQPRLYGGATFYATPAVAYGRVYLGSTDGRVYSFGATTGKLRWSYNTGSYVYASPAVWHRLVFVGSYDQRFYAFDAATGAVRWSFPANGQVSGSATVIDGVVYFATLQKRTYALDATTGRLLWSYSDGKYTPAVAAGGRLFLIGYQIVYGMVPRR